MCCFFTTLIFFGPRLAFLIYWLILPAKVSTALQTFNFTWLVGILGLIFAPWTILMYVIVFPMNGWDWLWMGLAIGMDIFSYTAGYKNRSSVPYYPEDDPIDNY